MYTCDYFCPVLTWMGNSLPGTCRTGALLKYSEKSLMLMVADMRMRRRSGRSASRERKTPRRKSQCRCLSWTSSTIMTWYWASVLSCWICRSSSPSVRKISLVAVVRVVSKRIWYPTWRLVKQFVSAKIFFHNYVSNVFEFLWAVGFTVYFDHPWQTFEPYWFRLSKLTLFARDMQAIRRGWVQEMWLKPAERRYWGTWVDLPQPVSPATTTTGLSRTSSTIRSRYWKIGRFFWSRRSLASFPKLCFWLKSRKCRRARRQSEISWVPGPEDLRLLLWSDFFRRSSMSPVHTDTLIR